VVGEIKVALGEPQKARQWQVTVYDSGRTAKESL